MFHLLLSLIIAINCTDDTKKALKQLYRWMYEQQEIYFPSPELSNVEQPVYSSTSYCAKSDLKKILDPTDVYRDINVYGFLDSDHFVLSIIANHTNYLTKDVEIRELRRTFAKRNYPKEIDIIYSDYRIFVPDSYEQIVFIPGQTMLCMFQKFNHIMGEPKIQSKRGFAQIHHEFIQKYPQCLKYTAFYPKTYRLNNKEECNQFVKLVSESKDQIKSEGMQYIIKENIHRGEGIKVLFEEQIEEFVASHAENGTCVQDTEQSLYSVGQKYINNPFTYGGKKVEFRILFAIASTYPLIVYYYNKVFIRRCIDKYNKLSKSVNSHIFNREALLNKMGKNSSKADQEELIIMTLEDFQQELLNEGIINDDQWLENNFNKQLKTMLAMIINMGKFELTKDPRFSEYFAMDFMMDSDLHIWFLEFNRRPQIVNYTLDRAESYTKFLYDYLQLIQLFVRSRLQRIRGFIFDRVISSKNKTSLKEEFLNLWKDSLEPEFSVPEQNLFKLLINENLKKSEAYSNLISDECIL